jgi:hypothetical protein
MNQDKSKDKLIEEYHQRRVRWTKLAIDQFSFFNNLLITISIGFLAFAYDYPENGRVSFSLSVTDIDWFITINNLSILFIFITIILGLIIALSRLLDFRVTRQINQVRQNAYEHQGKKLPQNTPRDSKFKEKLFLLPRLIFNHPHITFDACQNDDPISDKFRELRRISRDLGSISWKFLYLELSFLFLGITLHVLLKLIFGT